MYRLQIMLYKALGYVWAFALQYKMYRIADRIEYLANVKLFPPVEEVR